MGSVRRIYREGCYTEDSVRHVIEGSGNRAFLLKGSIRGN